MNRRLIRNAIKCTKCGEVIVSRHVHDFVSCLCGAVSADGGLEYAKRLGDTYIELAEYAPLMRAVK